VDVERNLISKAVREQDLKPLFEAKITVDFFQDEEHRKVFLWVGEYYARYGECPTSKALKQEFASYSLIDTSEPYAYYLDEMRDRRKHALMTETLQASAQAVQAGETDEAVKHLTDGLLKIGTEVSVLRDTNLVETGETRLERYRIMRDNPGLHGIPTGFPSIDLATGGLQNEQLITLVGLPKAGKSTIALAIAVHAHTQGKSVLFVGFEMSNDEQEARHDGMRAGINYQRLIHGKMTPRDERALEKAYKLQESLPPFVLSSDIQSATTVSGLAAKAEEYQPDLIVVDGAYLMESEIPGVEPGSPQALTSITRSLKRMAQRIQRPVLITTQGLSWKHSKKRGITADTIGYSSSFAQDSDVILGVESMAPEMMNVAKLNIVAARAAPSGHSFFIRFDWETGSFDESEEDEMEAPDAYDAGDL